MATPPPPPSTTELAFEPLPFCIVHQTQASKLQGRLVSFSLLNILN